MRWRRLLLGTLLSLPASAVVAAAPREVIVDIDIGDEYDALALALALSSRQFRLDAVITSLGDTQLRARMVRRLPRRLGRTDVVVAAGPATVPGTRFTQSAWTAGGPDTARPGRCPGPVGAVTRQRAVHDSPEPRSVEAIPPRGGDPDGSGPPLDCSALDAVATTLARLRATPAGRITLIELAPATTAGVMLARDPAAFRRLAGVVVMGGSVRRGYGRKAGTNSDGPSIEYNVRCDPAGFRALLGSGVPVRMMPLDATEIVLDAPAPVRCRDAAGGLAGDALPGLGRQQRLGPRSGAVRRGAGGVAAGPGDLPAAAARHRGVAGGSDGGGGRTGECRRLPRHRPCGGVGTAAGGSRRITLTTPPKACPPAVRDRPGGSCRCLHLRGRLMIPPRSCPCGLIRERWTGGSERFGAIPHHRAPDQMGLAEMSGNAVSLKDRRRMMATAATASVVTLEIMSSTSDLPTLALAFRFQQTSHAGSHRG